MNKVRMIGIVLLLVGILISFVYYKEENEHEFIAGVFVGAGAVLMMTAKYFNKIE